jgi:hypothetical protein
VLFSLAHSSCFCFNAPQRRATGSARQIGEFIEASQDQGLEVVVEVEIFEVSVSDALFAWIVTVRSNLHFLSKSSCTMTPSLTWCRQRGNALLLVQLLALYPRSRYARKVMAALRWLALRSTCFVARRMRWSTWRGLERIGWSIRLRRTRTHRAGSQT